MLAAKLDTLAEDEEEEEGEVLLVLHRVQWAVEKSACAEAKTADEAANADVAAKAVGDQVNEDLVNTGDVAAPPSPPRAPSPVNRIFADPIGLGRFLKVPISGYSETGALVFVP